MLPAGSVGRHEHEREPFIGGEHECALRIAAFEGVIVYCITAAKLLHVHDDGVQALGALDVKLHAASCQHPAALRNAAKVIFRLWQGHACQPQLIRLTLGAVLLIGVHGA